MGYGFAKIYFFVEHDKHGKQMVDLRIQGGVVWNAFG